MRKRAAILVVLGVLGASVVPAPGEAQPEASNAPVVFVHGLGGNAADVGVATPGGGPAPWGDLLGAIAERWPVPGVCQSAAQPDRPWDGSPCVFRYVEDIAEASEGGEASRGPNDSQSSVRDNAAKLADEVAEVVANAGGRRVVLVAYSMGGAIVRAYLTLHREEAARMVDAVVLVDAVASGSWGFAFIGSVIRRVEGAMSERAMALFQTLAAGAAAVDLTRPAPNELRPRSELFREIAAVAPPQTVSYYTFWGDVRVSVGRRLLTYDLPDFELPSLGDLGLLPGDPDPSVLPELGGQRFSPRVAEGEVALDVPHEATIELDPGVLSALLDRCGRPSSQRTDACRELLAERFDIPNIHTAVPVALSRITVDAPPLGGRTTLLDAVLTAIGRHQP